VNWLANNINFNKFSDKRKIQRYTLGVLYYSTNGTNWSNNNGWLTDKNECNWWNGADGLFCDENGAIFELDLYDGSGNNLVGTIPMELTLLSDSAALLALGDNSLMGTIPSEVGLLSKLSESSVVWLLVVMIVLSCVFHHTLMRACHLSFYSLLVSLGQYFDGHDSKSDYHDVEFVWVVSLQQ
jgi:hypothetical protein